MAQQDPNLIFLGENKENGRRMFLHRYQEKFFVEDPARGKILITTATFSKAEDVLNEKTVADSTPNAGDS